MRRVFAVVVAFVAAALLAVDHSGHAAAAAPISPSAVPVHVYNNNDQCVGYRVPLFVGGQDVVENLEVSDLEVYWSICGQLRRGVRSLPPGTSVNEVTSR